MKIICIKTIIISPNVEKFLQIKLAKDGNELNCHPEADFKVRKTRNSPTSELNFPSFGP